MKTIHYVLANMFDVIIIAPPLTVDTDSVVLHEMVSYYPVVTQKCNRWQQAIVHLHPVRPDCDMVF